MLFFKTGTSFGDALVYICNCFNHLIHMARNVYSSHGAAKQDVIENADCVVFKSRAELSSN
jgi:hypothetical protein